MKLEMTLPERPGFLHAVPLLNIFALVQLFFLLGPSLVWQSGVAVDLPPSRFQMERYETPLVVTLGPGEPTPRIHFARDSVTLAGLAERLGKLREEGAQAKAIVLLQTDTGTPVGVEREVTEMILAKGFRLALVGRNAPAGRLPESKSAPE
jgi:biopolymer transport protein ExbD